MTVVKFDDGQECSYDGFVQNSLDGLKSAVQKHKHTAFILIDGKSGKGKSTFAIQMMYYFNHKDIHIYYDPEKFLQGLAVAKPESCHIFDEAMILSNRSSLSIINRTIIRAMSMIRSKRIYIAFCINSVFDLDRNLVLSRADILFHVYGDSIIDKGKITAFFTSPEDGWDRLKDLYIQGKQSYSYSQPKSNYYASFSSKFLIDEEEYERNKQAAINEILSGEESAKSMTKKEKFYIRTMIYLKYNQGLSGAKIAKLFDLAESTVSAYMKIAEAWCIKTYGELKAIPLDAKQNSTSKSD